MKVLLVSIIMKLLCLKKKKGPINLESPLLDGCCFTASSREEETNFICITTGER